ncbi:hypothetical protein [Streptomyces sp. NPDC049881]|uniref:hypothetical protein n=1 Tax=Streptomyces sp. NPDC049881 TaxID=3155778 RepID=UPI003412BF5B
MRAARTTGALAVGIALGYTARRQPAVTRATVRRLLVALGRSAWWLGAELLISLDSDTGPGAAMERRQQDEDATLGLAVFAALDRAATQRERSS